MAPYGMPGTGRVRPRRDARRADDADMSTSMVAAPVQAVDPRSPRLRRVRYEPEPDEVATCAGTALLTGPLQPAATPRRLRAPAATASPTTTAGRAALSAAAPAQPGSTALAPATCRAGSARRRTGPPRPGNGTRPSGPPSAEAAQARFAVGQHLRAAMEVFDGRRPVAHLAGQVTPAVLRYWRSAAGQRRPVRGSARLGRLRLCLPAAGVAEAAVTCEVDGRARALAARFEVIDGRWRCTAVRLG